MIELGAITSGTLRIARAARDAVLQSGQAAVFLSHRTGEAVAVSYTDPSYDWLVRRHAEHLVGVYRDDVKRHYTHDVERCAQLLRDITDDLAEHVKQSPWWIAGRVARKRRAA